MNNGLVPMKPSYLSFPVCRKTVGEKASKNIEIKG